MNSRSRDTLQRTGWIWSDMFVHLGIIAFFAIRGSEGRTIPPSEKPCSTTTGTQSACVRVTECSPILDRLNQSKRLQPREIETLIKSRCGFEGNTPLVCCPDHTQLITAANPVGPERTEVPDPPDITKHPNLRFVNHEICGSIVEDRIIQGNQAMMGQFPWMALIAYNVEGNKTDFKCGGSLINERYVLTAAHCVTGLDPGQQLSGVRVGDHDLSTERDCEEDSPDNIICSDQHQDFLVESFHVHSGYRQKRYSNDIALIRMNRAADFRPFSVQPICLPVGNAERLRTIKAIVTGWGGIETGTRGQKLLQARLKIVPNDNCTLAYKNSGIDVSYKQICAGGENPWDLCAGDRGGPLQFVNEVQKYVQYGVVSFRPENCGGVGGDPGVYTNVAYYMDWILDAIAE